LRRIGKKVKFTPKNITRNWALRRIGKKVKFTPKNITRNWALRRIGIIDKPVNKGNQFTIPAKRAKTAPILKT